MTRIQLALFALIVVLAAVAGQLLWGDGIIWGSLDGDSIVWGTLGDGDTVVWGN